MQELRTQCLRIGRLGICIHTIVVALINLKHLLARLTLQIARALISLLVLAHIQAATRAGDLSSSEDLLRSMLSHPILVSLYALGILSEVLID